MPVGKHHKAKKHPAKLRKCNYPCLGLPRKAEFEGRALPDWLEDTLHCIAKLKINFKLVSNAALYLTRLKEMLWFWIDSKQRFNGVGRAFSKNAHWPQVLETMTFWGRSEWLSLFPQWVFPMPTPVCHIEYPAPITTYTLLGCGSPHPKAPTRVGSANCNLAGNFLSGTQEPKGTQSSKRDALTSMLSFSFKGLWS